MRSWRKVYSTILDSEQVSQLSDGAAFLLMLLIVAQDDTGYWPWTPTKVRRLITARPNWSIIDAKTYADELVSVGIAEWTGGGIVLLKGDTLNGTPRTDSKPEITPRIETVTPCNESATSCDEVVPLDKIRVDKSRLDLEKTIPFAESQKTPLNSQDEKISIPEETTSEKTSLVQKPQKPKRPPRTLEETIEVYGEGSTQHILKIIEADYGMPVPHYSTQAAEVKGMKDLKYMPEDIIACWRALKKRDRKWIELRWVATIIGDFVMNDGALPSQKGQFNGKRSNSREARDLPPTKGSTTEYYAKDMEYAEEQAKWRKEHGIGVGNTS